MTTTEIYELPYGEVFRNSHSDERCWRTAKDNLILMSEAGSSLHGISVGSDDRDYQGVCLEPPRVMLGTAPFEMYEYRTQPVGQRSGRGDIDLQVYGMAKWVRLICNGNPTHLMPLFAPEDKLQVMTEPGQMLRDNAHLFLAKSHARRFLGYLNRQRERMIGDRSPRINRPELVDQYGYDTKFASHALRIAMQGIDLMRSGKLTLPMPNHQARYLIDVREGNYTMGEVLQKLGNLERDLLNAYEYCTILPEQVDYDYVNNWLVDAYQGWWRHRGLSG